MKKKERVDFDLKIWFISEFFKKIK